MFAARHPPPRILPIKEVDRRAHLCLREPGDLHDHISIDDQGTVRLGANRNLSHVADSVVHGPDLFGGRVGRLDQGFLRVGVGLAEEQNGVRPLSVAPRPPGLLIIGFKGRGNVGVHHEAHIGLVDPHPERVCRHHHADVVGHPGLLASLSVTRLHPSVVPGRLHPEVAEPIGPPLYASSRRHVHDAGSPDALHHVPQLGPFLLGSKDRPDNVGAIEAANHLGCLGHVQQLNHVAPDRRRGRGRDCDRWGLSEQRAGFRDLQIVRTEIMSPLTYAMGFVHRQQGDIEPLGPGPKPVGREPLRGQIKQVVPTVLDVRPALLDLVGRNSAIDEGCVDALSAQSLHLILHQCDKRGNDQHDSLGHEGRHLVTEGFSPTGRQHAQDIPAVEYCLKNLFLAGPKFLVPPRFPHCSAGIRNGWGGGLSHNSARNGSLSDT